VLPFVGELVLGEDRVNRARLDARVAVDALDGVDVYHVDVAVPGLLGSRVDAVDGADLDAREGLHIDTRLSDHIRHGSTRSESADSQDVRTNPAKWVTGDRMGRESGAYTTGSRPLRPA